MTIRATIGVYPMRQESDVAITDAIAALAASGAGIEIRPMQTELAGEPDAVWAALRSAFEAGAAAGPLVVTVTISNACA